MNKGLTDALKMIAPGTPIREGLENILKAKTRLLAMWITLLMRSINQWMRTLKRAKVI